MADPTSEQISASAEREQISASAESRVVALRSQGLLARANDRIAQEERDAAELSTAQTLDTTLREAVGKVTAAVAAASKGALSLRAWQLHAVARLVGGESLCLTAATGAGKSMLFQVPTMMLNRSANEKAVLVVPLNAIGKEQVRSSRCRSARKARELTISRHVCRPPRSGRGSG